MLKKINIIVLTALVLITWTGRAENINGISIDFVNIENAGNNADTNLDPERNGYGAVGYNYRIGQVEVSITQFQASGIADSNADYWNDGTRTVGANAPVVNITWHQAARFCNFLTTSNANLGVYTISGGLVTGIDRSYRNGNTQAYVLPTEDEWYKAAYFTGSDYSSYANGPGVIPESGTGAMYNTNTVWSVGNGAEEQNGTLNMMGNVWEWLESAYDGELDNIGAEEMAFRGGSYNLGLSKLGSANRESDTPGSAYNSVGLRVVAIPEPGTISLMSLSTLSLFFTRTMRRRKLLGKSLLPVGREHLCDTYCTVEEWQAAYNEIDAPDGLAIAGQLIQAKILDVWAKVYAACKLVDQKFWNHMVVSHEHRMARKKAFRAVLKKKSLNGFDAFLALIMK